MTHSLSLSLPRLSTFAAFLVGLSGVLTALEATAAPSAPVAPIITSSATRFAPNNNGTVTDSLTGLVWLQNANCTETVGGIVKSSGWLSWANAMTWTAGLASGACGLTDGSVAGQWRLPSRHELQSLIDYTTRNPALPVGHPFAGVLSLAYWSSTTDTSNTGVVWFVYLIDGNVIVSSKAGECLVWPVRGGL